MEYEFRRNVLTGTLNAFFSMDHEVLGQWFTDELSTNAQMLQQIVDVITQLQGGKMNSWSLVGRSLTLEFDVDQVRVFANAVEQDEPAHEEEGDQSLSFYDAESESWCGLEDFYQVLMSWKDFALEQK